MSSHRRAREALTDLVMWSKDSIADFMLWLEFMYYADLVECAIFREGCLLSSLRCALRRLLERLRKPFAAPNEAVTWNRSEIEAELGEIADKLESAWKSFESDWSAP